MSLVGHGSTLHSGQRELATSYQDESTKKSRPIYLEQSHTAPLINDTFVNVQLYYRAFCILPPFEEARRHSASLNSITLDFEINDSNMTTQRWTMKQTRTDGRIQEAPSRRVPLHYSSISSISVRPGWDTIHARAQMRFLKLKTCSFRFVCSGHHVKNNTMPHMSVLSLKERADWTVVHLDVP